MTAGKSAQIWFFEGLRETEAWRTELTSPQKTCSVQETIKYTISFGAVCTIVSHFCNRLLIVTNILS